MIESIEQEIRVLRSIFWSGRDPEGRAFVSLADAYRRAGDFRQAVELLTEGLDRHPGFTSAHLVAAEIYHERGLTAEAELALRRVLDLDPGNAMALSLLAESLDGRGEAAEAEEVRTLHQELVGLAPEPAVEVAEPEPEADEPAAAEEPVVDVAELAPEQVVEVEALAPDQPVVDVEALAPDEPVVDVAELAPDVVMDVAELAPEPVVDVEALAPDEPVVVDEPVAAAETTVPDAAELMSEADFEPVVDPSAWADLAPEEQVELLVVDVADLAPDEEFEPIVDPSGRADLESNAADFEPVLDPSAWADLPPEPAVEPVAPAAEFGSTGETPEPAEEAEEAESGADLVAHEVDEEPMVTRTMAELFAAQGLVDRALEVFRQLLEETPGDAGLRQRVAELSARLEDSEETVSDAASELPEWAAPAEATQGGFDGAGVEDDDLAGHAWDAHAQADHHEVDTPFAWTHQDPVEESPAGPPISSYFSRLLAWQPGDSSDPGAGTDAAGGDDA